MVRSAATRWLRLALASLGIPSGACSLLVSTDGFDHGSAEVGQVTPAGDGGDGADGRPAPISDGGNDVLPEASAATPIRHLQRAETVRQNSSTTITTEAFPKALGAGDTVICQLNYNSQTTTVTSVADEAGNVYQRVGTYAPPTIGWTFDLWYASGIKAGSNVDVTATLSSAQDYRILSCHEYEGPLVAGTPLAAAFEGAGARSTNPLSTSSLPGLLFAVVATAGGGLVPGADWNTRSTIDGDLTMDRMLATSGAFPISAVCPGDCFVLGAAFERP